MATKEIKEGTTKKGGVNPSPPQTSRPRPPEGQDGNGPSAGQGQQGGQGSSWESLDAGKVAYGVFYTNGYSLKPLAIFESELHATKWLSEITHSADLCVCEIHDLAAIVWNSIDPSPKRDEPINESTDIDPVLLEDDNFENKLRDLVNHHSRENGSDTPDFILAQYLQSCLDSFDAAVSRREEWYGRKVGTDSGTVLVSEGIFDAITTGSPKKKD